MAGTPRDSYTFTTNGVVYAVKLPRNYYNSIDTILGLNKGSESAIKGKVVFSTNEAIKKGLLFPLRVFYKKGIRLQASTIVCAPDKVASALQELEGDNYRGFEIASAGFGRRRRLG
jgi:hypothetical protein